MQLNLIAPRTVALGAYEVMRHQEAGSSIVMTGSVSGSSTTSAWAPRRRYGVQANAIAPPPAPG